MTTIRRLALLLFAIFLFLPAAVHAQIGTTTQIITGHVVGPDSQPIAGARVDVTSIETGVVKHTATRADGRFSLLFRDGGAQYTVRVTFIGMAPATVNLSRQADEDRLVAEIRMGRTAVQLSAVQVRANATRPGAPPASNAGGTGSALPTELIEKLPVALGDLSAIAALAPGVIPTAGNDSTPASFSVAGQPSNQNNVTVDGSSFLFGSLPQDAIRSARIITNAYDVSRGQFTGGQVASTTKSGGQDFQGTATVNRQQPQLQFPTSSSPTFGQKYTQTTGSFGVGGPLLGENSFYFTSLQYDRKSDAVASLLDATPGALTNLGVNSDSALRFEQIVAGYGLNGRSGAPSSRTSTTTSALARIDWDLSDSHSLMVRGDYRHLGQDATRISPLALPQSGGRLQSDGGGAMATLTSSIGDFINEGRAYVSADHQSASAFLAGPMGVVTVASSGANTTGSVASLQFGGNPGLPRSATNKLAEFSDELSWLVADHRLKLGGLLNMSRSTVGVVPNRYGTFLYNSLADFANGRPALYARTLSGIDQDAGSDNAAIYLGDAWRKSAALQFAYGLRAEATHLPNAPAENAKVSAAFGHSTSDWPSDFAITPRFGFTYIMWNEGGIPKGSFRGGIGEFRGTVPSQLVGAVRNGTGLAGTQSTLLCVGPAAPIPNWSAYMADPSSAPSACNGGASSFASTQQNIVLFDDSFGAPKVWRASLGYTRRFKTTYTISFDGMFAYGVNAPYATDLNLPSPSFSLTNEGGRPVYARATDIVPTTGATGALSTRPQSDFGSVLAVGSGMKSRTGQMMVNLQLPGLRAGYTSVAYTFNRVIDQSNGYGLGAYLPTTSGNPNAIEWGTSDLERRHQVIATAFVPFPHGVDFTVLGRLLSGQRYTPVVNGDVNGDGSRNDRAFVPDPAISSSPLSPAIASLIANTDDRAASCLRDQLGRIASRNSCTTPWTPQLDVQLNWAPRAAALDDRLTISFIATNTLAGVDRLLHGDDLHGWGQPSNPDRTLLSIAGFDPSSRQYTYKVNSHFGTPMGANSAFMVPFQLALKGQVKLGTDPVKAQIKAVTGGVNGLPPSVQQIKDRILRGVPYPIKALLDQADSLGLNLTRDQRTKLNAINQAYSKQIDSVGDIVAKILLDAGPRPDLGALAPKLNGINGGVIGALTKSVKDSQAILTPEQWAKVPEGIRLPLSKPQPAANRPPG